MHGRVKSEDNHTVNGLGYTSVLIQGVQQVRESASGNQIIQSCVAQAKRREFKSLHFPGVLMQDCDGHSWR